MMIVRFRTTTLVRETFGETVRVTRSVRRQAAFPCRLRHGTPRRSVGAQSELCRGEPDPQNDPRDEALEHRFGIPKPAMNALCKWWDPPSGAYAICFKNPDQRPVVWRMAGDREWQYTDCPQPLKPHATTWKALDAELAGKAQ